MLNELFWSRVEQLRELRGISERSLSADSLMSENAYTNAKKLKSSPGIDFVDGIARILNVSVEYLITGVGENSPYIPESVPVPDNAEWIRAEALQLARRAKVRAAAIGLVNRQNPDARMGVARILELYHRADALLRAREERAEKKAERKKTPAKKSRVSPGQR